MSDIQREARELLYGTTAGEWVMALGADGYSGVDADGSPITWDDHSGEVFKNADAEFIAAAPRLVRELLAENERLTEQSNALNWDTTCLNSDTGTARPDLCVRRKPSTPSSPKPKGQTMTTTNDNNARCYVPGGGARVGEGFGWWRQALGDAVHALAGRTSTFLDRDVGASGPRVVWGDSRYRQLLDYAPGGVGSSGSGVAHSRPPVALDAVSLCDEIDRTVRAWQPDAGIFDGDLGDRESTPDTVRRLHLIEGYGWGPDDTDVMRAIVVKVQAWCDRIDRLLDPPARWNITEPCPACGDSIVYRVDGGGERVRTPALTVSVDGAECLACHTVWGAEQLGLLAAEVGAEPDAL